MSRIDKFYKWWEEAPVPVGFLVLLILATPLYLAEVWFYKTANKGTKK